MRSLEFRSANVRILCCPYALGDDSAISEAQQAPHVPIPRQNQVQVVLL